MILEYKLVFHVIIVLLANNIIERYSVNKICHLKHNYNIYRKNIK